MFEGHTDVVTEGDPALWTDPPFSATLRDGKIDPIDWIERIPFSETRDYVQRIMENLQVYRVRLGERSALLIGADLKRTR